MEVPKSEQDENKKAYRIGWKKSNGHGRVMERVIVVRLVGGEDI